MKLLRLLMLLCFALPLGASTYYMRGDGTAASKAAATSCSSASTAMNVTTHNALSASGSFSPGDIIALCDSGGKLSDATLTISSSSSGSSGNPITYENSGSPVIDAAAVLSTTWTPYTTSSYVQQESYASGAAGTSNFAGTGLNWVGGAFTPLSSYTITQVGFAFSINAGAPFTHPVTAYIKSNNVGGCATKDCPGTILATSTGTIQPTLTSSSAYYNVQFSGQAVVSGTKYWAVLSTTADASNKANWFVASSPGLGNALVFGTTGTSWTQNSTNTQAAFNTFVSVTPANVYQASVASQPYVVLLDGKLGLPGSSAATLTADGQWFWSSGTLYVYSASGSPSGRTVELGNLDYCITGSANYITIQGLACYGSNKSGIYGTGTNWVVSGNNVHDLGGKDAFDSGIWANGANWTIQNNIVSDANRNGVESSADSTIVKGNKIFFAWNGIAYGVGGDGAAVELQSSNAVVSLNYAFSNFRGVFDFGATNSVIEANVIANSLVNDIDHESGTAGSPMLAYGNTIIHNPIFTSGHAIACQVSGDGCAIENNNIYCAFTGTNVNVQGIMLDSTTYTNITTNYNNIFVVSGGTCAVGRVGSSSYSTLSLWQTALGGTSYGGKDANSISADPLFVNYGGGNYALSSSSPARGAGVNLGSPYNIGLLPGSTWPSNVQTGTQGSAWNMGAFLTRPSAALFFGIP